MTTDSPTAVEVLTTYLINSPFLTIGDSPVLAEGVQQRLRASVDAPIVAILEGDNGPLIGLERVECGDCDGSGPQFIGTDNGGYKTVACGQCNGTGSLYREVKP